MTVMLQYSARPYVCRYCLARGSGTSRVATIGLSDGARGTCSIPQRVGFSNASVKLPMLTSPVAEMGLDTQFTCCARVIRPVKDPQNPPIRTCCSRRREAQEKRADPRATTTMDDSQRRAKVPRHAAGCVHTW